MGRGLTFKKKDELWAMSQNDLSSYIVWLQNKHAALGTLPRKSINKDIEVASKIYSHLYPENPLEQ